MKISIITAVFNNRDTIADALDSALGQTHGDVELIVIDGASTDGTLQVLHGYADTLAALVSEPDRGIYDALNKGLRIATGEVVGFLHSDDLFADKHVLARIAGAFADPGVDAVYGDLVYVRKDASDQVVRYRKSGMFAPEKLRRGWMPPTLPCMCGVRSMNNWGCSIQTSALRPTMISCCVFWGGAECRLNIFLKCW